MQTFLKYGSLYVTLVIASTFLFWLKEGIPIAQGIMLALLCNAVKTAIVYVHGYFWQVKHEPAVVVAEAPVVEVVEPIAA